VVAYGACEYIDDDGRLLWTSSAGRWAQVLLPWGPDLIPQPGMLVRRSAWEAVGGLDESLRFAFDLDLLLRLRKVGAFVDVGRVVSSFRWHPDSLTVSDRSASLDESEAVKRRYLGSTANAFKWVWEKPVRGATRVAARGVTRRARRAQPTA
jgi:GT2 family glycosyltransferase